MKNIKETSLDKALKAARLTELPKQARPSDPIFWKEAIVLVRKRDLSQSYALAHRDITGRITYTADYGTPAPIVSLLSVHPYLCMGPGEIRGATEDERTSMIEDFLGSKAQVAGKLTDEERVALLKKISKKQTASMPNRIPVVETSEECASKESSKEYSKESSKESLKENPKEKREEAERRAVQEAKAAFMGNTIDVERAVEAASVGKKGKTVKIVRKNGKN